MAISYRKINERDWKRITKLQYPPAVAEAIERLGTIAPSSIVPAREVVPTFSTINQINQAFIKLKKPYRLRILQSTYRYFGHPERHNRSMWTEGCLVQMCVKI